MHLLRLTFHPVMMKQEYATYRIKLMVIVKLNQIRENVSLPAVEAVGTHTIILTAVDHAGNETVKEIHFEIKNPEQPTEDMMTLVTVAVEKSKSAQNGIKAALDKVNANSSRELINEDLNKALAANAEAKVKITRLKELLGAYNGNKIPSSQLSLLRNYLQIAEDQNVIATTKLNQAVDASSLSTVKARTSDVLRANGLSLNYLEFIKANFKAYGVK